MSNAIENLQAAQKHAMTIRPRVGGFPYLAEALRRAGVIENFWSLPACQSIYLTDKGPVVRQGQPLVSGAADIPAFDRDGLIKASYDVDLEKQTVSYYGCNGEEYVEAYAAVDIG